MDSSKPRALHKSALAGRQLRGESLQQENSDPSWSAMSTQVTYKKIFLEFHPWIGNENPHQLFVDYLETAKPRDISEIV